MILLIDIGNTLIKIGVSNGKKEMIQILNSIETNSQNWNEEFDNSLKQINQEITGSIISCVVPNKLKFTCELIEKYFNITPIILNNSLIEKLPLKFNLNNQQIGSDLFALTVGSQNYYGDNILVSLGTATVYLIIKNQELVGVIIGPGFTNTKLSLIQNAALIQPFILKPYKTVLGANTNHALSIGFGNGFSYMIKGTIDAINKELNTALPVIITGNGYLELEPFLKFNYKYHKEILMVGLIIIYQILNKNNKLKL